jgi:hypothetical protein
MVRFLYGIFFWAVQWASPWRFGRGPMVALERAFSSRHRQGSHRGLGKGSTGLGRTSPQEGARLIQSTGSVGRSLRSSGGGGHLARLQQEGRHLAHLWDRRVGVSPASIARAFGRIEGRRREGETEQWREGRVHISLHLSISHPLHLPLRAVRASVCSGLPIRAPSPLTVSVVRFSCAQRGVQHD